MNWKAFERKPPWHMRATFSAFAWTNRDEKTTRNFNQEAGVSAEIRTDRLAIASPERCYYSRLTGPMAGFHELGNEPSELSCVLENS
jgi:hypothetical protein